MMKQAVHKVHRKGGKYMFMFKDSLVMELNYVDTEFSGVFFQYAIEVKTH